MSSTKRGGTGRVEPRWTWRRAGSAVLLLAALALVPWIGYLAVTLPTAYEADHWNVAWVGFDVILLLLIATTAVLARRSHPLTPLTGFATGVLLVCDAWLDCTTSSGTDHTWALITALLVELPLSAVLLTSSLRLLDGAVASPVARIPLARIATSSPRRPRTDTTRVGHPPWVVNGVEAAG